METRGSQKSERLARSQRASGVSLRKADPCFLRMHPVVVEADRRGLADTQRNRV